MKLRSSVETAAAGEVFLATLLRGVLVFLAGFLLALVARKFSSSTEELIGTPGDCLALAMVGLVLFAMADLVAVLVVLPTAGFAILEEAARADFLVLLITGLVVFA